MTTPEVKLNIEINVGPFIRGMHDATYELGAIGRIFNKKPRPPKAPYPKRHSLMTAREYRAARRAYGRALRAHRKATK